MAWRKTGQDKLDKLVDEQFHTAQKLLLTAEGELENAQATVDVLRKRVARLAKLHTKTGTSMGLPLSETDAAALVDRCRARIPRNPEQEATS